MTDHRWHPTLRYGIGIALVAAFILGVRILWPFLTPLSLALLLTYILIPVVNSIEQVTNLPRPAATTLVHLALILAIILLPARLTPALVNQLQALLPTLESGLNELGTFFSDVGTVTLFGQELVPYDLYLQASGQINEQIVALGTRLASSSVTLVFGVATTFVSTVVWLLFMLVVSFYIVHDWPNISRYLWGLLPKEARIEVYYVTRRIDQTWHAFLRGQMFLSAVIFVTTTGALLLLGVPQAIFLGFLAGLLNLIPNLGPILSSVPAIAIALVQGSTRFDVSNVVFAVMVAVAYTIIQQLESNLLVPRIIGGSVKLHPAVVLLGAIVGLSTVGILGIFLAAPTLASLRVIGGYAYRKLLDPDFVPTDVTLPTAIAAIPDPRERSLVWSEVQPRPAGEPAWRAWVGRVTRRRSSAG